MYLLPLLAVLIVGCSHTTQPELDVGVEQMTYGFPDWGVNPSDSGEVDTTKGYEPAIIVYIEEEDLKRSGGDMDVYHYNGVGLVCSRELAAALRESDARYGRRRLTD